MDYLKIGQQLESIRERKGLTHHQIFEVTRIQPSILKDIETGQPQIAEVLFKGFIKTYCQVLDVDYYQLIEEAENNKEAKEQEKIEQKERKNENVKIRFFITPVIILIGLIVLLQIYKKITKPDTVSPSDSINQVESDNATDQASGRNKKAGSVSKKSNLNKEEGSASQKVNLKQKTQILTESVNKNLSKQNGEQTLLNQIKDSAFQHELLIQSINPLKIYFKTDKQSTVIKNLTPNIWFIIKAQNSLYLRFDQNTKNVKMFYNGKQWELKPSSFFENTFK